MTDTKIKSRTPGKTPGGHSGHGVTGRNSLRQSNNKNSALSKNNRINWDFDDGATGGSMTSQYQEYPKHIYNDPKNDRKFVVVNSEEEERAVLGGKEVIREEDEHDRLVTLASVNNVQIDKRWGNVKITNAIEKAGFDPSANPFK